MWFGSRAVKLPKMCALGKAELARVGNSLAFPCHPVAFCSYSHTRKCDWWIQVIVFDMALWPSLSLSLERLLKCWVLRFFYFAMLFSLSHATPHWGVSCFLSSIYLSIIYFLIYLPIYHSFYLSFYLFLSLLPPPLHPHPPPPPLSYVTRFDQTLPST